MFTQLIYVFKILYLPLLGCYDQIDNIPNNGVQCELDFKNVTPFATMYQKKKKTYHIKWHEVQIVQIIWKTMISSFILCCELKIPLGVLQ
jgi:hypothetical protein